MHCSAAFKSGTNLGGLPFKKFNQYVVGLFTPPVEAAVCVLNERMITCLTFPVNLFFLIISLMAKLIHNAIKLTLFTYDYFLLSFFNGISSLFQKAAFFSSQYILYLIINATKRQQINMTQNAFYRPNDNFIFFRFIHRKK